MWFALFTNVCFFLLNFFYALSHILFSCFHSVSLTSCRYNVPGSESREKNLHLHKHSRTDETAYSHTTRAKFYTGKINFRVTWGFLRIPSFSLQIELNSVSRTWDRACWVLHKPPSSHVYTSGSDSIHFSYFSHTWEFSTRFSQDSWIATAFLGWSLSHLFRPIQIHR